MTNKLISYLYPQEIETRDSEYNGTIKVMQFLGKSFVVVDDLTQSGGLVTKIWQQVSAHLANNDFKASEPQEILILGLGAGSSVLPIHHQWPAAHITGVEIDLAMIDIGIKYFELEKYPLKTINHDVYEWIKSHNKKYDLIYVDIYQGQQAPTQSFQQSFIAKLKQSLTPKGIIVFNLLSLKGQEDKAEKLRQNLKKHFHSIHQIPTSVNILIKCKTQA